MNIPQQISNSFIGLVSLTVFGFFVWELSKPKGKASTSRIWSCGLLSLIGAALLFVLNTPGAKATIQHKDTSIQIETPSLVDKIAGKKEKTIKAENANKSKGQDLIFSLSSTSPDVKPVFQFQAGDGDIKKIAETKDGREFIYTLNLPPGGKITGASPETVSLKPLDGSKWPIFRTLIWNVDQNEKDRILKYYKVDSGEEKPTNP